MSATDTTEMPPQLRAEALEVLFKDASGKDFVALDIATLVARPGEILAITGPSGSGKSTLLYAIAGLCELTRGRVHWGDVDLLSLPQSRRDKWRREKAGFIFQDFNLVSELSPLENVLLPARFSSFLADKRLRIRARDLMARFGIPESRRNSAQLSRGERQRLALARALLFDPPILLADEPTASLDAAAANLVIDQLLDLAHQHLKTVIVISHDGALISRSDRQVRLEHGKIISGIPLDHDKLSRGKIP